MAIGPTDGLYVSNGGNVVVYAGRSSKPSRTITDGIAGATVLAFDSLKQLLVYNANARAITIYPPQATTPTTVIKEGLTDVTWMTVGPTGTLYALQQQSNSILEFDHEGTQLSRRIILRRPAVELVDANDTLYVLNAGQMRPHVHTYRSGNTKSSNDVTLDYRVHQLTWSVGPSF